MPDAHVLSMLPHTSTRMHRYGMYPTEPLSKGRSSIPLSSATKMHLWHWVVHNSPAKKAIGDPIFGETGVQSVARRVP
eukprot:6199600-Pleurochrysis_carterae.AAC.2